eukprot:1159121-Pelagomonas_calceolata.AAC.3
MSTCTCPGAPVELHQVGMVAEQLQEARLHHHPPSAHAHNGHHGAVPAAPIPESRRGNRVQLEMRVTRVSCW